MTAPVYVHRSHQVGGDILPMGAPLSADLLLGRGEAGMTKEAKSIGLKGGF